MQKEDLEMILNIRPWVTLEKGTKFIGPKLYDLIVAYFITQGENEVRAKQFASAYITGIYVRL